MDSFQSVVDSVRKYLLRNKVKIIFGTPCFGGLLHNGFFQSMLETVSMLTRLGIPYEVITIGNESLIQRARNGIVAKFMADNAATHLMFIDADITFSWISIVKLMLGNKEFSGGCYPKKCFNWDKIKHHISKNATMKDDEIMARSLDYVFNPIYYKQDNGSYVIRLENGMAQVKDIGTGFMMIKKSVIQKMILKYSETKYKNNVAGYGNEVMNDYFYTLFDCCIDPVSRVYLSEDYLFCKRWIDIGGELWLDLNTNLNHTGLIDYKGCLALTIGEVDTLNQDAKILRAQAEKEKLKAASISVVSASEIISEAQSNNAGSKNKKKNKKKKNKNKNNNSSTVDSAATTEGTTEMDVATDDGEESDNEPEPDPATPSLDDSVIEQAKNGNHC